MVNESMPWHNQEEGEMYWDNEMAPYQLCLYSSLL
jgi:hypothetical protein